MQTRPLRSLMALAAAALVAAGCSSDSDAEATPAATTAAAVSTSAPTTAPPETTASPTTTVADTQPPAVTEAPPTESTAVLVADASATLERLELPEELGAGYLRAAEPGTPYGGAAWTAIADRPECAPTRIVWDTTLPLVRPLHFVNYIGPQPGDLRQVVVWGTYGDAAAELTSLFADDPTAAATCWQDSIRGLGLTDLVLTDAGRGEVPDGGAEIVWRRHHETLGGKESDRSLALIRLDSIIALVALNDAPDAEVVAILTDLESRLLTAAQVQ